MYFSFSIHGVIFLYLFCLNRDSCILWSVAFFFFLKKSSYHKPYCYPAPKTDSQGCWCAT